MMGYFSPEVRRNLAFMYRSVLTSHNDLQQRQEITDRYPSGIMKLASHSNI